MGRRYNIEKSVDAIEFIDSEYILLYIFFPSSVFCTKRISQQDDNVSRIIGEYTK